MARLVIKSDGFESQAIELKLGVNRFGRSAKNDFQIEHATVSATHCEVRLDSEGVTVRDCKSTNGTFLDGEPIHEAKLEAGQVLQLGDVELLVENTEVKVEIPKFDAPQGPAPPVVLLDGSLLCPRHPHAQATHQCTFCREVLCDACVHHMRRRGGKTVLLCPLCSHKCEPLGGVQPKKRSLMDFLNKTVKLPFLRSKPRR
ncbi:FHA domain containing protein [Verrucomicrobia bacterium]|nr:FHA domain containing protein [Verrucomicrobiota bacterium]